MKRLRFSLIGCGRISISHVKALIEYFKEAELVSISDIVEEKALKISEEYINMANSKNIAMPKPVIYRNYKEMLEKENIDVCAVATESGYHANIAIYCMNLKKHVVVEKPMALSLHDADQMNRVAEQKGLKLMVCYPNRFNPIIQKLKKAIDEGRFGKIFSGSARVLWNRNQEYYNQAKWRGTWQLDGGCLMNQCSHNIDLLQWMINSEVHSVYAQTSNFLHPYIQTEDYGSLIIKFKNGVIGNIEGTVCVYKKNLEETISILGENGTVVIGGSALNKITIWDFRDKQDTLEQVQGECGVKIGNNFNDGHNHLYKNIIEAIRYNRPLLIDGQEGKKSLIIILMAYQSQRVSQAIEYKKDLYLSTKNFI